MNKQIPNYLRLVTDTSLQPPATVSEDFVAIERVCHAFERSTQWRLEYGEATDSANTNLMWSAPVNPGVGTSPGHIRLLSPAASNSAPRVPLEDAVALAEATAMLWGELLTTRRALWQREAELAAGVPLIVRQEDDEAPALAERLEAVLRGGGEAVGCQAAALYLLDPATTELKLRSCWGLPHKRLAEPARPLRPALADLEALLGHAVVMTEPDLFDYWKVPETGFASCVCVPVSSPSMPLGTLWVFSNRQRDFNDAETNILEVVAGRLAADLEREVLVDEAVSTRRQTRQIAAAERVQQDQLPRFAPLVDGWEIAAHAYHTERLGGTFYDWSALSDGSVSVLAGDVRQPGIEGALTCSALRGAARAFGPERKPADELLEKANSVLWTGSAGNARAGLFHAIVEQGALTLVYAVAGPMRVLRVGPEEYSLLAGPSSALGVEDEIRLAESHCPVPHGGLVLAYGTTFLPDADEEILSALDQRLVLAVEPHLLGSAEAMVEIVGEILQEYSGATAADRVVMLLKRK